MKLYTIDYNIYDNYGVTEAIDPETKLLYRGCKPRDTHDYSDIVEKLNFRIKANSAGKRFPEMNYEAVDFFNGPHIIDDSRMALRFNFFVISPKMKELLCSLKLPENKCRFYSIKLRIHLNTPEQPYYLFQFDTNIFDLIDYSNTSFKKEFHSDERIKYFNKGEITSKEQWRKETIDGHMVITSMGLIKKFDLFYWRPFFVISEEMFKLFQKNNMKGIKYKGVYDVKEDSKSGNDLGYANFFGGYEVIMEGESSMDGLSLDDFPRV